MSSQGEPSVYEETARESMDRAEDRVIRRLQDEHEEESDRLLREFRAQCADRATEK